MSAIRASFGPEIRRTKSSALARRPRERLAAPSASTPAASQASQNVTPTARLCGRRSANPRADGRKVAITAAPAEAPPDKPSACARDVSRAVALDLTAPKPRPVSIHTSRRAAFRPRNACASALIVRCGSWGPVSMPRISQTSATSAINSHGVMPRSTWRLPPWPGRGRCLSVGRECERGWRRRWAFQRRRSIATTVASDTDQVATAGTVERWKPLTQPHHAHNTTRNRVLETTRRACTSTSSHPEASHHRQALLQTQFIWSDKEKGQCHGELEHRAPSPWLAGILSAPKGKSKSPAQ